MTSTTLNQPTLRDSAAMRWIVLLFLAFAMFCSYIFMDILSPIKDLMQSTRGWDSTAFGTMQGSETFLNVFVFFLIFAGIILDKMGVRFTAVLSGAVMLVGATINWYAVTDMFQGSALDQWFTDNLNYIPGFDELGISPFYEGMPSSAKFSAVGFMIFGCGVEMAGITVSRGIVKWFKGREMALAMGSEMALARLGVATCMIFSPMFARLGGDIDVSRSVAFGVVLLMIALIMFIVYFFMDKKLDAQTGEAEEKDDPFKISDIGAILKSSGFWLVALLCVLYYSAIFPFQKYAVNMLQCNLVFEKVPADSFWATNTVTVIQYCIMLVVAAASFASNFIKKNKGLKYGMLVLAVVAVAGREVGYMWRYRRLTDGDLSWWQSFKVCMMCEFTSAVTPTAVGGSSLAMVFMNREGINMGRGTALMIITLFLDELFFVVSCPLIVALTGFTSLFGTMDVGFSVGLKWVFWGVYALIAAWTALLFIGIIAKPQGLKRLLVLLFTLPLLRRWRRRVMRMAVNMEAASVEARSKPVRWWVEAFAATVVSWTCRYVLVCFLFLAFVPGSDSWLVFARQGVIWLLLLVCPTPGGSGVGEWLFSTYYADMVSTAYMALVVALAWRVLSYYVYLIAGLAVIPSWLRGNDSAKRQNRAD